MPNLINYDPAMFLTDDETIAEYLKLAQQDADAEVYASALKDVERVKFKG